MTHTPDETCDHVVSPIRPPRAASGTHVAHARASAREVERALIGVALQLDPNAAAVLLRCLTSEDFHDPRMATFCAVLIEAADSYVSPPEDASGQPGSDGTATQPRWDRNDLIVRLWNHGLAMSPFHRAMLWDDFEKLWASVGLRKANPTGLRALVVRNAYRRRLRRASRRLQHIAAHHPTNPAFEQAAQQEARSLLSAGARLSALEATVSRTDAA